MKDERYSYKTQFEFLEFLFSGTEVLKILTCRFNICSIIRRFFGRRLCYVSCTEQEKVVR